MWHIRISSKNWLKAPTDKRHQLFLIAKEKSHRRPIAKNERSARGCYSARWRSDAYTAACTARVSRACAGCADMDLHRGLGDVQHPRDFLCCSCHAQSRAALLLREGTGGCHCQARGAARSLGHPGAGAGLAAEGALCDWKAATSLPMSSGLTTGSPARHGEWPAPANRRRWF